MPGERTAMPSATDDRRVLVLNPASGSEDHVEEVTMRARAHDFEIRKTEGAGDGAHITREVTADGADLVAAAGGDGTINEVVNGLVTADALETTTLAVVPAGTGNNFASNIGVGDIAHAFALIDSGERRAIDVGIANGRGFVNSCVGGVTAEASSATTSESKREFGVLAYVLNTLDTATSFDPPPLRVELPGGADTQAWQGPALFVFVGNCRRFDGTRQAQANVEDGLFEVTLVERGPATGLVGEAALGRFVDREADYIVHRRTPSLSVSHLRDEPIGYSLDGELLEAETLTVESRQQVLSLVVGEQYEPKLSASIEGTE